MSNNKHAFIKYILPTENMYDDLEAVRPNRRVAGGGGCTHVLNENPLPNSHVEQQCNLKLCYLGKREGGRL